MFPVFTTVQPIPKCRDCSPVNLPVGERVIPRINAGTTPTAMLRLQEENPEYQWTDGAMVIDTSFNVLTAAAWLGNLVLMRFIVDQGGRHLLDFGNFAGETPLYHAVRERRREAAIELIRMGANPNLGSVVWEAGPNKPANPLWVAITVTHDVAMQRLLIKYGGRIHRESFEYQLTEAQRSGLTVAAQNIAESDRAVAEALPQMPTTVTHIVFLYSDL